MRIRLLSHLIFFCLVMTEKADLRPCLDRLEILQFLRVNDHGFTSPPHTHRRRIHTEEKAMVVAVVHRQNVPRQNVIRNNFLRTKRPTLIPKFSKNTFCVRKLATYSMLSTEPHPCTQFLIGYSYFGEVRL